MSDTIYREDAIKAVFQKPAIHGSDGSWYHADDIKDALENAPSATAWIPCSERLPSENGDYFVTLENGVVKILGYSTTQRTTYPKGFYYIKDGFSWRQMQNPVVAWMPKPAPWASENPLEGIDPKSIPTKMHTFRYRKGADDE